jgi:hypothetical protein
MSQELDLLSELLGEVIDPEYQVYQIFLKTIHQSGVLLQSPPLDNILVNKINPTWAELITEHALIVYDTWNLGPRSGVKKPLLIDTEEYELSLVLEKETIVLGQKTLAQWRQRITTGGMGEANNFIGAINKNSLEWIKHNSFVVKVKLINADEKLRPEAEKRLFLGDNTQAYLKHLLEKALSDYSLVLKGDRAKLFNAPKFTNLDKTREYLLNQHFNGFGLKNVIHIRYVLENLKDKLITNDELINEVPSPVLLQQENLLYFKSCLLLNIPFSGR